MLESMDLPEHVTPEEQQKIHALLRKRLTSFTPVASGSTGELVSRLSEQHPDFLIALQEITKGLSHGHWLGAMELYENGFNVFVRNVYSANSVKVWIYRKEE